MTPDQPGRLPPMRHERLYQKLASHISDFIEAQGLVGGDRLPPERQLAADLGVSRSTLSRALAALETSGRIEVRHGVGALVREPDLGRSGGAGGDGAEPGGDTWQRHVSARPAQEVVAAREAILSGLARAAAVNPQSSLRVAMLAADGRPRSFEHLWRCVRHLADAPLLSELDETLADNAPAPEDSLRLRRALDDVAEAILAGDASAAATACLGMLGP